MANIRYIALIAIVIVASVVGVLWKDDDAPTITFTRPAQELETLAQDQPSGLDASSESASARLGDGESPLNGQGSGALMASEPSIRESDTVLARRDDLLERSEEQLTEEELAEQIELAQRQLAQVEVLNARKQAQVEQALAEESSAEQPLIEAELAYRIGGWRQAWRTGDTHAYFQFYSDSFKPAGGKTVDQWKAERVKRLNPEQPIDLNLEDFEVSFDPQTQRSLVTFRQFYKSGNYQDTSNKRLILANEQGQWKIVSEVAE